MKYIGGDVIHMTQSHNDMYASIDLLSHRLAETMKRRNKKRRDLERRYDARKAAKQQGQLETPWKPEETDTAEDEEEDVGEEEEEVLTEDGMNITDPTMLLKPTIPLSSVKPKVFSMPPITVEDALLAFEYIGNPFYVFRNKVSNAPLFLMFILLV